MGRLNISFLITNLNGGGAARTVASLSEELTKLGCKTSIIQIHKQQSFYEIHKEVTVYNLGENEKSLNIFNRILNQFNRVRKIRKICLEDEIEVLFAMNVTMIYFAVISTIMLKTKIIGTERSNPYVSLDKTIKQYSKKIVSVFTDGFVFQSIEASYFYPNFVRKKAKVIQNAVYNKDVLNIDKPRVRKKVISSVGRLIESKGFDVLINAFSIIVRDFPDYKLEIYGEGPYRSALERHIQELGLEKSIELRGNVKNVAININDTSIFVFPSRHEGMPNALIEAMALGLPCISTNCCIGPKELIEHNVNGILIEVDDVKQMAIELKKLIEDTQFAADLGRKASEIKINNSVQKVTKEHLDYFKKIVNN